MLSREDIVKVLKPYVMEHPNVLVAWEGGSAATNHIDAYSDVDLMIVANKDDIETLFKDFDQFLNREFGITEKYRMKEPAWHGFSQCFYHLETTEPWLYIDLCILPKDIEDRFIAKERHGEIVAWKDTIDFVNDTELPQENIDQRVRNYYRNATESEFILRLEIDKAFRREKFIDAYSFMQSYLMRHLAPLMNIEHRPERVDFGLRYADREYSTSDYTLIVSFYKASSLNELEKVFKLMHSRYETLRTQFSEIG